MRHQHSEFKLPPHPDGHPIDRNLISQFVGATWDGCTSCQNKLMAKVMNDAATVGGLVEAACVKTEEVFGGLPPGMMVPGIPGVASPQFRELALVGAGGNNVAMYAACERMTPAQRREVARSAAAILAGALGAAAG